MGRKKRTPGSHGLWFYACPACGYENLVCLPEQSDAAAIKCRACKEIKSAYLMKRLVAEPLEKLEGARLEDFKERVMQQTGTYPAHHELKQGFPLFAAEHGYADKCIQL